MVSGGASTAATVRVVEAPLQPPFRGGDGVPRSRAQGLMSHVSREAEVHSISKDNEFTLSLYFPSVRLGEPASA